MISGNVIEVTSYEKLNVKSGGARDRNGKNDAHNYRNTQKRRRNSIRHLICSNFDSKSKFVTLTFNDKNGIDISDVKACNGLFKKFIMRIKYRFPDLDFKYVAVIEFQDKNKRGAVHYHMICNLPYIKKSELSKIWGYGFVKINAIDKVDNVGAYVIKYMTSDMDDKRLCGLHAYLHSRNLEKPVELTTWRDAQSELFYAVEVELRSLTPCYIRQYQSSESGQIEFIQYNRLRSANSPLNTYPPPSN